MVAARLFLALGAVGLATEELKAQAGHEHHHVPPPIATVPLPSFGSGSTTAVRPPRTLHVGPDAEFSTPVSALSSSVAGDTIRVARGVYVGDLAVARRVTLIGEPGAVLEGDGKGTVVTLAAAGSQIHGFSIRGGGRSLDADDAAVKLVRCHECAVRDNVIPAALHGIYVLESSRAVVSRNEIEGDPNLGAARRGNGIHIYNSAGAEISGNRIRETRDGVYFSFATDAVVAGNEVGEVRYGLHYMYSDGNRFERNVFRSNMAGAALMFSDSIVFRGNTFSGHVGIGAYGILLQTVRAVNAEANVFAGNRVGIHLDNSQDGRFARNLVIANGVGFDLLSSAERNVFTENEIRGNRLAARQAPGSVGNAWSEAGRGNYWASPDVFDLGGDGIGERPFPVGDPFSLLAARRPVLEPFVGTPAAGALSWAEQAFPVFDLSRAVDPAPLARSPLRTLDGESVLLGRTPPRRFLLAGAALGLLAGLGPLGLLHVMARRIPRPESG